MNSVFFTRQIPITPELQVTELKSHANGFLRYNNINDLAHSGSAAMAWFLNRGNTQLSGCTGSRVHRDGFSPALRR